ncbi:MAG TPA: UDP-N-acetylmuramoyl-tripeptide--D-alanyl-D-alanine ligase [Pirellulales bacterium]|jgi:UDP-N-acetylmuramoyl-tripeptide--D-alanyl-D-alanine ligase|nr:UDP-N-acetylmuramoyl-tripeptide--D-alanyl-D-alanine ligase [Pirellulales bacterium]
MQDLTIAQLYQVVGGRLRMATLPPPAGEAAPVGRIVIDSRQVEPGDTFWGLAGARHNGGSFAEDAYARRAAGVVVAGRYVQPAPACWSLEVDDAAAALTRLARWNRDRFTGRVVAVTGSVGKTTTRQMIHAVLGEALHGSASPRNYNNHLGVPLSLFELAPNHDYAVLEVAASRPGEIDTLAELVRPEIGVITRLGEAHLGGFGSPESLVCSKLELLRHLPAGGWAVLSGDDERLRRAADCHGVNVVWVGRSLDCDLVATGVQSQNGRLHFVVDQHAFDVPVWGRHHLAGALAAIAVGKIFGLSHGEISAGLAAFQPPPQRCEISQVGDTTIINDTYNASPTAMRAALELLRNFEAPGRRVVVCGDMRELGEHSDEFHRRLGDEVVTLCGADLLVACGQHAQEVADGARQAGMSPTCVMACRSPQETLFLLNQALAPGDVVLVKGSRALAMEGLVTAIEARVAAKAA